MKTRAQAPTKTTYFRRKNKNSYALNWRNAINLHKISQMISTKEQIQLSNLILVHRGQQLSLSAPLGTLDHMQIVHIIDCAEVQVDNLKLYVRSASGVKEYQVTSSTKIRDFICQKLANINTLPYFYIGLVYLGKVMNPQKSFREELVQNQTELVSVDIRDYIIQKKQEDDIVNITDIINPKKIQTKKVSAQEQQPEIVLNQHPQPRQKEIDPDLIFTSPPPQKKPEQQQNTKDQLTFEKPNRHDPVDLNQTKYPLSIYQLELQSRYDGPHNETHLLLDRLDSLEQMPESELPQPKFQIKISQVDSEDSDEQNKNRVQFNDDDSRSIYSQEIEEAPSKDQETPPSEMFSKRTEAKKEELGSRELQLGDLLLAGQSYRSQTVNFLDKMLQDYKFMFDKGDK